LALKRNENHRTWMTLKVSTATGTAEDIGLACLPEQGVFNVQNICKTRVLVRLLCSYLYLHSYGLAK